MLSLLTIHWRSIGLLYLLYIPQHTTVWIIHLVLNIPLLLSLFFIYVHATSYIASIGSLNHLYTVDSESWQVAWCYLGCWLLWILEKPQSEPRKVVKPRHVAWIALCLWLYGYFSKLLLYLGPNLQPEGKKKKKHQCSFLKNCQISSCRWTLLTLTYARTINC